jgi:dethiobiotin synthetase
MQTRSFFVSGIGTEIGKTFCSAVLTEALQADYWKAAQAGNLDELDRHRVQSLVSNLHSQFHPERYLFNTPCSPHEAARIDGITMQLSDFSLPQTNKTLLVEGAGGLMVPLNEEQTIIDLIQYLQIPVILVSKIYLGSINHTLLSAEALKNRGIPVAGILFNGPKNDESVRIILRMTGLNFLGHVQQLDLVDKDTIRLEAERIRPHLMKQLNLV